MDKFYNIKDKIQNYESPLELDKAWEELALKQENLILKKNLRVRNMYLFAISGVVLLFALLWILNNFYFKKNLSDNQRITEETALTQNENHDEKETHNTKVNQLNSNILTLDTLTNSAIALSKNQNEYEKNEVDKQNSKMLGGAPVELKPENIIAKNENEFKNNKECEINKKPHKSIPNLTSKGFIPANSKKLNSFYNDPKRNQNEQIEIKKQQNFNSTTSINKSVSDISSTSISYKDNQIVNKEETTAAHIIKEHIISNTKPEAINKSKEKFDKKSKETLNAIEKLLPISKAVGLNTDLQHLSDVPLYTFLLKEKYKKNFVLAELFGQGGYASINYGRVLFNRPFGQTFVQAGISIDPHKVSPDSQISVPLIIPISINQTFSLKKQHAITIGIGVNIAIDIIKNYPDNMVPFLNGKLGYQFQKLDSNWFYKVEMLPFVESGNIIQQNINSSVINPGTGNPQTIKFGVWGGIGFGWRF